MKREERASIWIHLSRTCYRDRQLELNSFYSISGLYMHGKSFKFREEEEYSEAIQAAVLWWDISS